MQGHSEEMEKKAERCEVEKQQTKQEKCKAITYYRLKEDEMRVLFSKLKGTSNFWVKMLEQK